MRVLIVSEGKHEAGDATANGALENLVKRLINSADTVCEHDRISRQDLHAFHGRGRGLEKRAIRWMLEAEKRGCEAIVLVTDEDGYRGRLAELDTAQASLLASLPRAMGLAIRTFDAWMIADETALGRVLGTSVQRSRDPEQIRDPKSAFERVMRDSASDLSQTALYAEVSKACDLGNIERRCPRGFAPFAARVKALKQDNSDDGMSD